MRIKTLLFLVALSLILVACGNKDKPQEQQENENVPVNTETILESDEFEKITIRLEDTLRYDWDSEYMYHLDKIEVQNNNTLSVTIDLQEEPKPSAEEVMVYTIEVADFIGAEVDLAQFENGVQVTMFSRIDDDEVVIYGQAYNHDGEITFKESDGMDSLR